MTHPADLIFTGGDIYTLTPDSAVDTVTDGRPDNPDGEAIAIRDGDVIAVNTAEQVSMLEGVETETIDLNGATILPGFIDAHTHMDMLGRREYEADLGGATGVDDCVERLRKRRDETDEGWILGFGYDESEWDDGNVYLDRNALDDVSTDRPVVAVREDMHTASVNSVVLETYGNALPSENVQTEDGEPTGVLVENAVEFLFEEFTPSDERLREYLLVAQRVANQRGVTGVHDMIRRSNAPRIYRDLDIAGELTLRVRLNYWTDHLDAVLETGLRTNHGSEWVRTGAIKSFTDGSIGGRTAKLTEPYADAPEGRTENNSDNRGEWVVEPEEFRSLIERADDAGLQCTAHAIGDEAIELVLDTYEGTDGDGSRHRIEHAEVLTDELVDRLADSDVVVSMQPNFLKWAREDGLYSARLGDQRRVDSNQFGTLHDRGATLAFGSDCMPLDPLFGIDQVVNGPTPEQSLSVTAALRAYTSGAAHAGFDEKRLGQLSPGYCADLVVLSESPWESDSIADIDVKMTVVGGDVVFDDCANTE